MRSWINLVESAGDPMRDLLSPKGESKMIGAETGRIKQDGISILRSPEGSFRYLYCERGEPVAVIQIMSRDGKNGVIANAYVVPNFRRRGIATHILAMARKHFESVRHSDDLSQDARAWIGATEPLNETMSQIQHVHSEYYEGPVEILTNPSRAEFSKLLREYEHARGFLDVEKGEVHVWFAAALHHDVEVDGEVWLTWNEPRKGDCLISYNAEAMADLIDPDADDFDKQSEQMIMAVRPLHRLVEGFRPVLTSR